FAGTFLVFSDYMRGAVRLSSLMQLQVTFVWTHDSVGLGEDGPTHQPVEHLAALRAMPGLDIVRPADANEVRVCWKHIIERSKPAGIILSRQNLPVFDRVLYAPAEGATKGAYVIAYGDNKAMKCDVIILASGSEVSIALQAQKLLADKNIKARVVSTPCIEWFYEQPDSYQEQVLPKSIKARVSVEAGVSQPWHKLIGDYGVSVSLEHFGASGSASALFKEFGFTAENVAAKAEESFKKAHAK
ncbi:MAG: transketolase, partial [Actinobacteria bacterium]|nr:transketolase [Actinomycetota bacterium]